MPDSPIFVTPMIIAGKKAPIFYFVLCLVLGLSYSCNTFDKLVKSDDMNVKLDAAIKYYEEKDYYHAMPLLEDLLPYYKGTKTFETIYYYYANCFFGQEEYLMAAFHYKNYYNTLAQSSYAEDCLFLNAKCYYLLSPAPELDQDYTHKAIGEFQLFANSFPTSPKVSDANTYIDQMRAKLEVKEYLAAKMYYDQSSYKAAAQSFYNLIVGYPGSAYEEEAYFLIVKSKYAYAANSILTKQLDRYKDAMSSANAYIKKYPQGHYEKETNNLISDINRDLEKIKPLLDKLKTAKP